MSLSAWFHCASGISGDMTLGALVDAGAPLEAVREMVARVVPTGWTLEAERVQRGGVTATRVLVEVSAQAPPRSARTVLDLIDGAALPDPIAAVARGAVSALAEAEAAAHGQSPGEVHLHEVGATDAVVDLVGSAAALHLLGISDVYASAVASGAGTARSAHGPIPVPAPAAVELLRRAGAPLRLLDTADELVTPTGAALLCGMGARFDAPTLVVSAQGFGAGGRDPRDRPNVLQVLVGKAGVPRQEMFVIEANLDDATPEVLAHVVDQALAAGAADAWLQPIVMKKGRPGVTLSLLAPASAVAALEELVLRETGSFGLRRHPVERQALDRDWVEVSLDGHPVRVKRALLAGEVVTWAAEFADARAAAFALGRPLAEVMGEAVARARRAGPTSPSGT